MTHVGSTQGSESRRYLCRPRDGHRCLVDDVLRGMSRQAGAGEHARRPLSDALERALRRHVPAQWVRIRALLGGASPRPEDVAEGEAGIVSVPIPTRGGGLGWVLEIGLVPGQVLSNEHWQAIRRAAGVWELAAELDRKGGMLPRVLRAHSQVRDGAAPLIGTSPAMCHLRERIERVAATDFTVLIEGWIVRKK